MMWSALLVPIITILVLFFFFRRQLVWWEPVVCFVPSIIIIPICILVAEVSQTSDTEWLTDKVVRIEHHEPYVREWEEYVPEQGHYDKDGNYVVDIPAHWETHTHHYPEHWDKVTGNKAFNVTESEYKRIKSFWANHGSAEQYIDLTHPDQRHRLGDGRGDMFKVDWPGKRSTIEPVTWLQTYENRIQVSSSILKFPKVSEEVAKGLFDLPAPDENKVTSAILGKGGITQFKANKELMQWNALIGPRAGPKNKYKKAGRLWVLIFQGGSVQDGIDQENYWQGGNKNELTLCIGVDKDYKIKWTYVISWTKNERLKIDIRDFPKKGTKLDLNKIADYMGKECYDNFERREFDEFNYLAVEPPSWAIWTNWILNLLVCGGIAVFCVLNPFDSENPTGRRRHRFR